MRVSALWVCLLLAGSLAATAQPVLPQVTDPLGAIQTAEVLAGGTDPFEVALAGMASAPAGIRSGAIPASRARGPAETTAVASIVSGNRYFFYTPEMSLLAESALGTTGTPAIQYEYVWFGGEPVAQIDGGTTVHWTFADHLGTPWVQTDSTNVMPYWRAEYEPYGRVFSLSTADQHQPLRLPGQEAEQLNLGANGVSERSYNVFRWYRPAWGRYTQADPVGIGSDPDLYRYGIDNPVLLSDATGLDAEICCRPVAGTGGKHCYLRNDGHTYSLFPEWGLRVTGVPSPDDNRDKMSQGESCKECRPIPCQNGPGSLSECLKTTASSYPVARYDLVGLSAGNSNTFAAHMSRTCCQDGFPSGFGFTPGSGRRPPHR